MPGETDLAQLLRALRPVRQPGTYVFCTVSALDGINPDAVIGFFREAEGLTLILPQTTADQLGLPYSYRAAWLTLTVHSALEAVGLTAAVARVLAEEGISCNVVAGYYHDHLFVAAADAERALRRLEQLAATGQ